MIAFQIGRAAEAWSEGEILVFEACERVQIRDGDDRLAQVKISGPRAPIYRQHLVTLSWGPWRQTSNEMT